MAGMGEKKALWWKNLRKTDHLENLGADGSFVFFGFSSVFPLSKKMGVFLAVFTDFSRLRLKFTSEVVVLHGIN
jgi:hypothetical protein